MMRAVEIVPVEPAAIAGERGPVPELRWLDIADLRIDESYQRPILASGVATIKAIVKAFDWRMFGPVVVSPIEGGAYAIVDGQHRTTAALTCGIARIPCLVIQADRVTQAKAFAAINGRVTPVPQISMFRSRVAAGDAKALEVRRACDAADVTIVGHLIATHNMKPRQTISVYALETQIGKSGFERVVTALRAIVAAAHDVPGLLVPVTIQAFCEVLVDHPEWNDGRRFVDVFRSFDLETQLRKARDDARAKRMPVLPFVEAALITHAFAKLGDSVRVAA